MTSSMSKRSSSSAGLSRKFAVPFMEHLDHLAITRREADRRVPGPNAREP